MEDVPCTVKRCEKRSFFKRVNKSDLLDLRFIPRSYSVVFDTNLSTFSQVSRQHLEITFDEPQHAVAPGQIAALYSEKGEWCLGSGEIVESREAYPNSSRELDSDYSHSSRLY